MKAPYKYPYISMFVIGYYFLEHQGYYYKLRKYFGYPEVDEINYVVSMTPEKLVKLGKVPNRLMLLYCYQNEKEEEIKEIKSVARKSKEKKRSPILFGEINCKENDQACKEMSLKSFPSLVLLKEGQSIGDYTGPLIKNKIMKFIKNSTPASD
ncbi:unnamed protein product [Blepharisma stoltei]|uniref:Thioredoxin domain-containing protein n=1 Tax=Blepharisma stoltei TaxID=1481888 RepID=A0AAU9IBX6_9CILI|nr:unnamed protein product [Blepharisma stoltei]